jgi:hypothetical protein
MKSLSTLARDYISTQPSFIESLLLYIDQYIILKRSSTLSNNWLSDTKDLNNSVVFSSTSWKNTKESSVSNNQITENGTWSSSIKNPNQVTYLKQFSKFQLIVLQSKSVKFLANNVHLFVENFIQANGIQRILTLIKEILFHQPDDPEYKHILHRCIIICQRCSSLSGLACKLLLDYDMISSAISILSQNQHTALSTTTASILTNMFIDKSSKENAQIAFREAKGFQVVIKIINEYVSTESVKVGIRVGIQKPENKSDTLLDPNLQDYARDKIPLIIHSLINCIWEGLISNNENQNTFGRVFGPDTLFSLLEVAPYSFRPLVIRTLSEIQSNKLVRSVSLIWKSSRTFRDIPTILSHCWLDEELRLGITRDDGVIRDIHQPLSTGQKKSFVASSSIISPLSVPSDMQLCSKDTLKSCTVPRSRKEECLLEIDIYGLIAELYQKLGFYDSEGEDLSQRNMYDQEWIDIALRPSDWTNSTLSYETKQVISMGRRYTWLKQGEWWLEVEKYLKESSIIPIESDLETMEYNISIALEIASMLKSEQEAIRENKRKDRLNDEKCFINGIITQRNDEIKAKWLKNSAVLLRKRSAAQKNEKAVTDIASLPLSIKALSESI